MAKDRDRFKDGEHEIICEKWTLRRRVDQNSNIEDIYIDIPT